MGGAFGGKETQAALPAAAAALAAAKTHRPAKICLDRDDDMLLTGKRHDFEIEYDAGFDDDGRIAGIEFTLASRCGYSTDLSLAINDRAMFHADNCYFLHARHHHLSPLSHPHGVEHRLPRLWRAAGHDGDRAGDGCDRAEAGQGTRWKCARVNLYGPRRRATSRPIIRRWTTISRPTIIAALETQKADYAGLPRRYRRLQCTKQDSQTRHFSDAGEVRYFLHHHPSQPGRRPGACLCRWQRASEPWRHRDGAGPQHQSGADGGRGVQDRHGARKDHRHHHG